MSSPTDPGKSPPPPTGTLGTGGTSEWPGASHSAQPLASADLATQATDFLERVVVGVRDKTTRPVVVNVRRVVYGTIAAFGGLIALVLVYVTLIRLLTILYFGRVWLAHLTMAVLFTLLGALLMAKRKTPVVEEAMRR